MPAVCRVNTGPLALGPHPLPTHLQKFEYFFKDALHVWKEGHTVDRQRAMGKGLPGRVLNAREGLMLTWYSQRSPPGQRRCLLSHQRRHSPRCT